MRTFTSGSPLWPSLPSVSKASARSSEFQQRVRESLRDHKPGEWISGFGWDQTFWPDKRDPTNEDLDAVSNRQSDDIHASGWPRSRRQFARAESGGITSKPPIPSEAGSPRSAHRRADRFLEEDAARPASCTPRFPPPSLEQRRRGIELVLANAARSGVTSLQDCSVLEAQHGYFVQPGKLSSSTSNSARKGS